MALSQPWDPSSDSIHIRFLYLQLSLLPEPLQTPSAGFLGVGLP